LRYRRPSHVLRNDGCGGLPEGAELVTAADTASSRTVRKIVLRQ
jgi:hypothetical protein